MLKEILDILLKIESTTGKGSQGINAKTLQDNWEKPELESVLQVGLNQFKLTHLNKLSETTEASGDCSFETFIKLMNECLGVKACTNDLRDRVTMFVNSFEGEQKRMLTMIVTKNVNIGLGRKQINKAIGRTIIPVPSAQLASPEKEMFRIDTWDTKFLVCNVKYDGCRMLPTYTAKDGWKLYTRNFNVLDSNKMSNIIGNLEEVFKDEITLVNNGESTGFFIDGELIAKDSIVEGENSSQARQSITGSFNKVLKGKAHDDIDKTMEYVIFDFDCIDVLEQSKGVFPYSARRDKIESLMDGKEYSNISLAVEWIYDNSEEGINKIKAKYNELVAKGEEGVIIKNPKSVYECKRATSWIKMKEIISSDLKIVDFKEGKGKYEGILGALIVEFSSGERVNVSGFGDDLRKEIWSNKEDYIGKIVEVEYNAKSKDKKGKCSLFLPVFKNVRYDKTEADKYDTNKK